MSACCCSCFASMTCFNRTFRFDLLWERITIFWRRITSSARAPTIDRIANFDRESTDNVQHLRRQLSLEARHGSVSTMQDSDLSDKSPSNDTPSQTETVSQTSRQSDSTGGEANAVESKRVPTGEHSGQVKQDTPLLRHKEDKKAEDFPSTSFTPASKRKVPDSSEKSYSTFSA